MRFRSYASPDRGAVLAATAGGAWHDLGSADLVDIIADGRQADATLLDGAPELSTRGLSLLPPVQRPGKILCVGLNYVDHAAESPYENVPDYPTFFTRFASTLIADGDAIIRPRASAELDFEGEMAVIIGTGGRHIPADDALAHVAGYSVFNDASIRDYQFLTPQWTPGKNFDATGAFGPDFVSADEVPPGGAGLSLEVDLNGAPMQRANTSDMVFSTPQLIALASVWTTLEPGDVIVSGTPAGVGFARRPQVYMAAGDVVEVRIEGIGTLRNPVEDEPEAL